MTAPLAVPMGLPGRHMPCRNRRVGQAVSAVPLAAQSIRMRLNIKGSLELETDVLGQLSPGATSPDLWEVARVTGLEPATSGVTGRHSNQLSYTRA